VGARTVAEQQLRDRVALATHPAGPVTARIESFPFLGRLLTSGNISKIRVSAGDVVVDGLSLARVSVDLDDVTFDRNRLLADRTVVLDSLGHGTAQAEVTQDELSKRLGVAVTLAPGRVQVRVAGQAVTAKASVSENTLHLAVAGLSVPGLKIPTLPLLPCVADAVILAGRIRLTCSIDKIPAELVGRPLDQVKV
jgi:hypothetical protein